MKYERPCGARRECRRQALRKPRGTTANRAARRERESPIGPPYGAHREQQRQALRNPSRHNRNPRGTAGARKSDRPTLRRTSGTAKASPPQPLAAQPQPPRHGGSVAGSRGGHADGGTRHRASSRRLHRTISPWHGGGSRGATVGRPSAHCASPRRHSGPRSSPPIAHRRGHIPRSRRHRPFAKERIEERRGHGPFGGRHRSHGSLQILRTRRRGQVGRRHRPQGSIQILRSRGHRPTRGTSSPLGERHILRRRQHIAHRRVHIPRSRGHISRSRRHRPFGEKRIEGRSVHRPTGGTSRLLGEGRISRRRGRLDQFAVCVERK